MEDKGQILLYQTPDGESRIEVRLQGETVWLNQEQMAELFQRNISTISRHINNAFEEGELKKEEVIAFFANTTQHGAVEGKSHKSKGDATMCRVDYLIERMTNHTCMASVVSKP